MSIRTAKAGTPRATNNISGAVPRENLNFVTPDRFVLVAELATRQRLYDVVLAVVLGQDNSRTIALSRRLVSCIQTCINATVTTRRGQRQEEC